MVGIPSLSAKKLVLRPFELSEAGQVAEYCADWDLAKTTVNIPHPYELNMAQQWIASHERDFIVDDSATFAVTLAADGQLVGAAGIHHHPQNRLAEIGYWIGKPHWNKGYATSAARAIIEFGFEYWNLNRIQARHMTSNPASGRVMLKAGMTFEGILRQASFRWGSFVDIAMYSILREERN